MGLTDRPDAESIGCGFTAFKESEEVMKLIETLKDTNLSLRSVEKNRDRFIFILTQYQDQPHLLDPYLENIISSMLAIIQSETTPEDVKHNVFKYVFVVMSVKTYKKIVTYLPHEVKDLLPVLKMLEKQDPNDVETWQTRYVLLIWLSIISKIPFPLSRLETSEFVDPKQTIIFRIVRMCKLYCFSKDACAIAAVFLIAHFLTRSDVKKLYLQEMITWCLNSLEEDSSIHGPLAVLSSILKHCAREDLKPYTQTIMDKVISLKLTEKPFDLVRKYAMKVVQRLGFVLLRTKLATWRYQRVYKPINLTSTNTVSTPTESTRENASGDIAVCESEDQDVPPVIEDILEYLIQGLRDKTITIRWSAAKGIGRITARLPIDLADDVVGYVLNLFSGRESNSAWHGGCLALAELGRRGLLLPHRLNDVIPLVVQALVYDEPRAYGPVVSIIRDAACYVCWSFARAFEPHIFEPYVKEIAATLLIVTCFDREINCRRAASAAFQENVGRQGNFPHGIDIFTVADYFEVGVRSNAYLNISIHIAQYNEYTKPFINHLIEKKINHWDIAIRELAAKALHNLTGIAPDYMVEQVLPKLVNLINSIDLNVRHGTLLAIAEILEALYNKYNKDITTILSNDIIQVFRDMAQHFQTRGWFKGLGGELMKQAFAKFIRTCSIVRFPIHSTKVVDVWQSLLEESLHHDLVGVRLKAAKAHKEFLNEYYTDKHVDPSVRNVLINNYLKNLFSNNQIVRIGFAQAIGYFPLFILKENIAEIINKLISCTQITDETTTWAESRKEALHSLTMVVLTLGVEHSDSWKPFVMEIYECYLCSLGEYTTDSRGDIGAWVREEAMAGLHSFTQMVLQAGLSSLLNEDLMAKVIGSIAQQAVERIDKIRAQAGTVFSTLIHSDPEIPNLPYHKELKEIFSSKDCKECINWKTESITFPRFVKMLLYPPYTDYLLRGIIFSVGGLTESLVKHSSVSLFTFLKEVDDKTLNDLCTRILNIFEENNKNERMITSILAFLDRLLSSGCIQSIIDDPNSEIPDRMLTLVKKEMKCQHKTQLLISSIQVFCQLLQVKGPVSKKAFAQLSIYLCHKFKYLRKAAAIRTYEALTLYGEDMDISEEKLMRLLTIINECDWEDSIEQLRPIRNQLCELMNIPAPKVLKK